MSSMKYEEIKAKIKNVVNIPIRHFKSEELKGIIERYHQNHPKSLEIYERMKKVIPGGVEHNLSFNYPFPLASKRVFDCYMETVDNIIFTDYLMDGGPIILGHNNPQLTEKIIELIREIGPCHGITNEYEYLAAEQLKKHFPSCELIRWLQSGTEADMLAIRVARVFTRRKWIIKMGGSYHGWSDQLVFDMKIPGTLRMESHGIPKPVLEYTLSSKPNDIDALRELFMEKKKIAAVIIEPQGGESGATPTRPGFNKEVEELCKENGALLISDEVVSAFRLHMGGGQAYFGYTPDLSVFGKIVGHGYPSAAALGGREDIMRLCSAGVGGVGAKRAYCGGTIAANPLTCAAAYYAIKLVEETNATEKTVRAGTRLSNGLNELFEKYNLPWFSYNFGGTVHFQTSYPFGVDIKDPIQGPQIKERKEFMEHMGAALVDQELISVAGSRFYTCMLHTDEIIDETLQKIDNICQKIE